MPFEGGPCPTCGTDVLAGASRCPGCGRIFGEENRCPHCHAIAAVIPRGGGFVCAACGKPRTGGVDLSGDPTGEPRVRTAPARRMGRDVALTRARGRGHRLLGVTAFAGGIFAAAVLAALVPGVGGLVLAAAAGAVGAGVGALSLRAGSDAFDAAATTSRRALELEVMELAAERGGALTVTEVAQHLAITTEESDQLLTSMVGDGSRIGVDVDDEGVLRFVFHEVEKRDPAVKVRVETEAEVDVEAVAAAEAEAERRTQ